MTHSLGQAWGEHLLSQANATELYQICRAQGISVKPQQPRAVYMEALLQAPATAQDLNQNPVDEWRQLQSAFVEKHWQTLRAQITCPISSGDFKACWGCLDMQVMSCVEGPGATHKERLIQLRRKNGT